MIFSQLTASSSMMWANLLYILFVSYFTITNADEYMKREFSLVKPYFGEFQKLSKCLKMFELGSFLVNSLEQ